MTLPKPGDLFELAKLAPLVIKLIEAIRLAAKDRELTPDEVRSIGAAFVALVAAVVRTVRK